MSKHDLFTQYLNSLPNTPTLTEKEETALAQRIRRAKRGKHEEEFRAAVNELVEANLRLVVRIARPYAKSGRAITDMIQDGNIGLIKAAESFDPGLGYRFTTFADWWIRKAVQRGIGADRTVYLPEHMVERINAINRASRTFLLQFGREPEPHEIAEQVKLLVRQITEAIDAITETVSTSAPTTDSDDLTMGDTLPSTDPSALDTIEEHNAVSTIDEILGELTPAEEFVIRAKFGFYDDDERVNIAAELGISNDTVRTIELRALGKLRERHGDVLGDLMGEAA